MRFITQVVFILFLQNIIILSQEHYEPIYNMPGSKTVSNYFGAKSDRNDHGQINPNFMVDVNNDGKADIVCTRKSERGVWVQLSQGESYSEPQQWYPAWDTVSGWDTTNSKPRFVEDIDGDGYNDYIGFGQSGVYVAFSDGTGFKVRNSEIVLLNNYGTTHGYNDFDTIPKLVGDVSGDGKADIVVFENDGVYVSTSTGSGFDSPVLWVEQFGSANGWNKYETKPRFLADIDGDGKLDIVGFGASHLYVSFSTGSSFESPVFLSTEFPETEFTSQFYHPRIVKDVDGDGKADIVAISQNKIYISLSNGRKNFKPRYEFQPGSLSFTRDGTWSIMHLRHIADVNGDGIGDFIGFSDSGTHVSFVTKSCSHSTRLPENDCVCQGDYYETGVSQCSTLPTNCGMFAHMQGDGDVLYLLMDGDKIPMVPTSTTGRVEGVWVIVIDKLSGNYKHIKNFDVEQDPDEANNLNVFLQDGSIWNTNVIIANYGLVTTNWTTTLSNTLITKGDMTGGSIVANENFGMVSRWGTIVGHPHNQHRIVGGFMYNSNCIFECRQQCATCNKGVENCLTCAPNRENPPTCTCKSGYYELPWVGECIKESQQCAVLLTSVSLGGYNLREGVNYGSYINELRSPTSGSGLPEKAGLYMTQLDELGQIVKETYYNTLSEVADVQKMIDYINTLVDGTIVMVSTTMDTQAKMTTDGWNALGLLGLDTTITYEYLGAIAFIGKKGQTKDNTIQQYAPVQDPNFSQAIAQQCLFNCVHKCAECNQQIDNCTVCSHADRVNPPLCDCKDGYYDDGINPECQPLPSDCGEYAQVFSGQNYLYMYINGKKVELQNTATTGRKQGVYVVSYDYITYEVKQKQSFDIGKSQDEADRLETFIKNTLLHPNDILVGSYGDVSTYLTGTLLSTMTTYWQWPSGRTLNSNERFAYIAKHRSAKNTYLTQQISSSVAKAQTCIRECAPKCGGSCSNGYENCNSCADNRQSAPQCECQAGFYEVGHRPDCIAEYSSCSKTTTLISYGGYDIQAGKNFGIYFNNKRHTINVDSELSRLFFIVQMNSDGTVKDSKGFINYGGSSDIDPGMKNYIQSIQNGTKIYHITNGDAYTNRSQIISELESLGYDSTEPIDSSYYLAAFAMIGEKGLNAGEASQQKWQNIISPNYAYAVLTECIRGCDYKCSTCYGKEDGSMTQCGQCSHITRENAPTCGCKDTYYDDGSSQDCKSCVHPCQNCSDINTCTSCVAQTGRATVHPCLCEDGYYENASNVCTVCPYPCSKCNDQAECTECNSDTNRLSAAPDCECKDKFYDNGSGCPACDYKCATCSNTVLNCGQCSHSTRENAPTCSCKNTYYDDGSSQDCKSCVHPCVNCSDLNTCTSCVVQTGRATSHPCLCEDGYYENASKVCTVCPYPCSKCNDQAECTECNSDTNRLSAAPDCECNTKFYDNGSGCPACNYKCATCSNTADNCGQCSHSTRENAPTCGCKDTYYDDGSSQDCKSCVHPCKNCSDLNTCTSCVVQTGRATSPPCFCEAGYYENSSNVCTKCPYNCDECSDENTCTKCPGGLNRSDNKPNCECLANYYDKGDETIDCLQCQHPCQNCTDQNTCTSCVVGLNRQTQPPCLCENGYFNNDQNECQQCQYPCANCSSLEVCISCSTAANRLNQSSCDCSIGYYDDNTQCQQCNLSKCVSCKGSPDNCTNCEHETRDFENECKCKIGYFDDGNTACSECHKKCKSCVNSSTDCIECSNDLRQGDNCDCPSGYYSDDNTGDCLQCKYNCECQQFSVCTQCLGIDKEFRSAPQCSCINGYYQNQENICQKCNLQCQICSQESSNCVVCQRGKFRTMVQPQCQCQDGYYEVEGEIDCKECPSNCKKCDNNGLCTECVNKEFNIPECESNNQSFTVVIGNGQDNSLETIQSQCNINCSSCETTSSNCLTCVNSLNRAQNPPQCDCIDGYHDFNLTSKDCYKCSSICKTCISQVQCLSCFSEHNREIDPVSLNCKCKNGYTETNNREDICVPCFKYRGQCFQQCPQNTISDAKLKQCTDYQYSISSNAELIFICLGVLLVFQLALALGFHYFSKKKIFNFQKLKTEQNTIVQQQSNSNSNSNDEQEP